MIEKVKCFLPALLFAVAILLSIHPDTSVATLPVVLADTRTPTTSVMPQPVQVIDADKKVVLEEETVRAPALSPSSQEGEQYGYADGVYRGAGRGYNGNINVEVTVADGKIASVVILSHIEDQEYMDQAVRVINSIINNQSTNVDAVSGATYSSNGIVLAVRDALRQAIVKRDGTNEDTDISDEYDPDDCVCDEQPEESPGDLPPDELVDRKFLDGTYTGTAKGYNGDITVEVIISDGELASVTLLSHTEDREYLDKAMAVTTAILQKQSTNVDAVSGATYSSYGIILAVRDALAKAAIEIEDDPDEPELPPIAPPDPDAGYIPVYGLYNDGDYTGSAAGYEGFIFVKVSIVNNNIVGIEVTRQIEEPAYYKSAVSLLDRIIKRQTIDGVDAVSGATYTSNGLLGAVAQALSKARIAA
jgi:uncharacterized protein with FMN-binding domain